MTRFTLPLIATTLTATFVAPGQAQQPAPVRVDAVAAEQVQQVRQVTGNVRAVTRSRIAAIEPGRVEVLNVREGDHVTAGQKLAVIDSRRLQLQLAQLEADMTAQEALLAERVAQAELRENDLNLLESMQQRGAVNPKELSDARLELTVAQARRDQAERALNARKVEAQLLQQRHDDTIITAPFDGVVIARLIEQGEWIAEGAAVVELATTGMYEVWLDVPQRFAHAVSRHDLTILVDIEAVNRQYESSSLRIVGDVDASSRTFSLVADVEDLPVEHDEFDADEMADGTFATLSPGMSATAYMPTGALATQLTLHKDAVLRDESGTYVFVVRDSEGDSPEQVSRVSIDVLFSMASPSDRLVVRSANLNDGDRVVVEGNERLHPMAAVRVVESVATRSGR